MQGAIEKQGSIGIIWIDNPPVNAISHAVRQGIVDAIETAAQDDDIEALVLACRGRTFLAGADITEFGRPMQPPSLPEVIDTVAASEKIVVAALFGTALGGGFEVALGCNYRISLRSGKVGLPEINLGLLPGAQGTQRLPRAAGVDFALKTITSGKPVSADDALEAGAIDRVVDDNIVEEAVKYAQELVAENAPLRRTHEISIDAGKYDAEYFAAFRKSIARKTRGMTAPERIVRCVEAAVSMPFAEGAAFEREMFMACRDDPQSAALQHVFFAEREAAKVPGLLKDAPLREIKSVGMIGAGTMGGGISMNFANAGIPVTLLEMSQEALDKGLGIVRKNYEASARKGRISEQTGRRLYGAADRHNELRRSRKCRSCN